MIACTWSSTRLAVYRRQMAFVVFGARGARQNFWHQDEEEALHDVDEVIGNVPCASEHDAPHGGTP